MCSGLGLLVIQIAVERPERVRRDGGTGAFAYYHGVDEARTAPAPVFAYGHGTAPGRADPLPFLEESVVVDVGVNVGW